MIEYQIDPTGWFSDREIKYTPKHFVVSKTPLTNESKIWILNKLKGRFSVASAEEHANDFLIFSSGYPAFEDPKEAIIYELTWS